MFRTQQITPEEIVQIVQKISGDSVATHVVAVACVAEQLRNKINKGNKLIIRDASLWHDLCFFDDCNKNHEISAKFFVEEYGNRYSKTKLEAIRHCIVSHSMQSAEKHKTDEAIIVNDACKIAGIQLCPQIMLKTFKKYPSQEKALLIVFTHFHRLYQHIVTIHGKIMFKEKLKPMSETFTWLKDLLKLL